MDTPGDTVDTLSTSLDDLTERQAAFVHHYLANGGNASAAALAAGYAYGQHGRRLMQQGTIQRAMDRVRPTDVLQREATRELAKAEVGALARVSGERIVSELAKTAFSEPAEPPSHSEKLRALDILAKVQGLYNENPIFVQVKQYVQSLPPDERRELLLDRGRLIELLEGQGYTVEAAS